MTPHKAGKRGTFILDRKTRVGRIAIASGTTHAPTFRRLNEMLTALDETGRGDLLREIRDGKLKPLAVYEAFRVNELHRLPTGAELKPLSTALEAWYLTLDCSASQKAIHRMMKKRLGKKGVVVTDLPSLLAELRESYRAARHPASFNRIRASVLSFVRDTMKRSHRIYGEVRDVSVMKEKKSPERHILTWAEVHGTAKKMRDLRDRAAVYGMALTGMGPKEWYIDGWRLGDRGVTIHGEKRKSRARIVPSVHAGRFATPLAPSHVGSVREQRRFGERLLSVAGIRPYDLRRTYANWLESANIPRTRRKAYLGHAGGDVTSVYERHEVEQFLAADAKKIEAYLAKRPITSHITLTSGGKH